MKTLTKLFFTVGGLILCLIIIIIKRTFMEYGSERDAKKHCAMSDDTDTLEKMESKILANISRENIPTIKHIKKLNKTARQIIKVFKDELGTTSPGRVVVWGSYGMGTALANDSDYDIVIYFNRIEPPYTQVLADMEFVIKKNAKKLSSFKWIRRTTVHISFSVRGIQFDISPASHLDKQFVLNKWSWFTPSPLTLLPTQQYIQTMKKISEFKDPPKYSFLYYSSLAIDAVSFLQRQNSVTRSVIRLSKYWARHVTIRGARMWGRSILIETIAIYACRSLDTPEMIEENMGKAFIKFLEFIAEGMNLRLYAFGNYKRENIPDSVFNQTPLVLSLIDPNINLMKPIKAQPAAVTHFQDAAETTLKKIRSWESEECRTELELRNILSMHHFYNDESILSQSNVKEPYSMYFDQIM